jgi:hypothetical protein
LRGCRFIVGDVPGAKALRAVRGGGGRAWAAPKGALGLSLASKFWA